MFLARALRKCGQSVGTPSCNVIGTLFFSAHFNTTLNSFSIVNTRRFLMDHWVRIQLWSVVVAAVTVRVGQVRRAAHVGVCDRGGG